MSTPMPSSLDDTSPVSQPLTLRKSLRKPPAKLPVLDAVADEEEIETTQKKKSKRFGSSVINRIWNDEDELTVLKGLVDYRVETGIQPNADWDAFYRFIGDSIVSKFSKEQLLGKISKMKRRFFVQKDKINQGEDPLFTSFTAPKAYEFSSLIWGQNDSQFAAYAVTKLKENNENTFRKDEKVANAESSDENVAENETSGKENHDNDTFIEDEQVANAESSNENAAEKITEHKTTRKESHDNDTFIEDEQMVNIEPLNENVAEKSVFDGDKLTGKESHDNDVPAGELCSVLDAYETLISQDLSSNEKALQLEKLTKIGNEKRKEISKEWKEICAEKAKLKMKKLRLAVKLAEGVSDN